MFASTVLNYMDRQTITLVERQISESFSIPNFTEFGWILAAFSMTYALFQVPAGYLVDRWDLRWTYAAAVAWWSLAAVATAIVPSLGWLFACRALLGVGESFNWPCALRVTARVLPPKDRSLGNGIFNSGAAVGAVLTPIVVTCLSPRLGWRGTFLVIGSLGFLWVAVWILLVRGPRSGMLARQETAKAGRSAGDSRMVTAVVAGAGDRVCGVGIAASPRPALARSVRPGGGVARRLRWRCLVRSPSPGFCLATRSAGWAGRPACTRSPGSGGSGSWSSSRSRSIFAGTS